MDCKTARLLLNFTRIDSQDLEEDEAEALASHLAGCQDCGAVTRAEQKLDDHIGRAMRHVTVPDGLRDRLLLRLANQRDLWYRRWVADRRVVGAGLAHSNLL